MNDQANGINYDVPHSMPYMGWPSMPAAEASYQKHPQYYQHRDKDEEFDQEVNVNFEKEFGENVQG